MKRPGVGGLAADLRRYLEHKNSLFSPEISEVIADVNRLTSSILSDGFQTAIAQLQNAAGLGQNRPFIEVCDSIIEHHLRIIKEGDREIIGKSLFEAYIYLAGAEHVFEPANKTRVLSFLRQHGTKDFAALFLSLHLFNLVCNEIRDDVRARMPDQRSFELYMVGIEAVCRDFVTAAMKIPAAALDQRWAAAVCANIETQLLKRR